MIPTRKETTRGIVARIRVKEGREAEFEALAPELGPSRAVKPGACVATDLVGTLTGQFAHLASIWLRSIGELLRQDLNAR